MLTEMLWLGATTLKFFLDYSITLLGLPFNLDLVLVLAAFFLLGYETYQAVPDLNRRVDNSSEPDRSCLVWHGTEKIR